MNRTMTHLLPLTGSTSGYPTSPGLYLVAFGYDETGDYLLRVCRWHRDRWWPVDEYPRSLDRGAASDWCGPLELVPHKP